MDFTQISEIVTVLCDLNTLHQIVSACLLTFAVAVIGRREYETVIPLANGRADNTKGHCQYNSAFHGILLDRRPLG